MQLHRYILISFVLFINGVTSSLLAFTNVLLKRNEAQHCCHKHGMTLMAIKNENEQKWMEEKFMPILGESGTFWIGVFSDDTTTDVYDASKQVYTWSNWDESTLSSENNGTNGSVQFNSTLCVIGDLSQSLKWVVTNCDERHPYVCQTFDEAVTEAVDVGEHKHVSCPEVLKYISKNILRDGNVKRNGSIYSGTNGIFTKDDKVYALTERLDAQAVTTFQDCIVLCTTHGQCNEVIVVSEQICILYT